MRIIFLDVDGVLNSDSYAAIHGWGGHFSEWDTPTVSNVKWDPVLVDRLRVIVESTGASIVMSSTWRIHFSVPKFKQMFALYGWENPPILDKTKDLDVRSSLSTGARGLEVNEWLSRHPEVTSYVILDDMPQFLVEQQERFVNTYFEEGLTDKDVQEAIRILNTTILNDSPNQ